MTEPRELISAYLYHTLSPEQADQLCTWVKADPRNAQWFARETFIHRQLRDMLVGTANQRLEATSVAGESFDPNDSSFGSHLLMQVLEEDRKATERRARQQAEQDSQEAMRLRAEAEERRKSFSLIAPSSQDLPPVRHIVIPRAAVYGAGMLIAALIALAVLPYFSNPTSTPNPTVPSSPALATLVSTVDAIWDDQGPTLSPGKEVPSGSITLRSGLAQLRFHNGATVILRGPATFEPIDLDRGRLHNGQLVAHCPPGSEGFSILTHSSRIVDLGTEFGVTVEDDHRTQVHVFQGRVIAALPGTDNSEAQRIETNQTVRIDATTNTIERLASNDVHYTRQMVRTLDLADIVAGGDGRGARTDAGIDPVRGTIVTRPVPLSDDAWNREGDGLFRPVTGSRYIAGAFVPNPARQPVVIDPAGRTFDDCPRTDGMVYGFIWAGTPPVAPTMQPIDIASEDVHDANGRFIVAATNMGWTIDLQALAGGSTDLAMHRFTTIVTNLEATRAFDPGYRLARRSADFWVLVDGQVRFSRTDLTSNDGRISVDVVLTPADRYLTIIATDAGNTNVFDWLMLHRPTIEMIHTRATQP